MGREGCDVLLVGVVVRAGWQGEGREPAIPETFLS